MASHKTAAGCLAVVVATIGAVYFVAGRGVSARDEPDDHLTIAARITPDELLAAGFVRDGQNGFSHSGILLGDLRRILRVGNQQVTEWPNYDSGLPVASLEFNWGRCNLHYNFLLHPGSAVGLDAVSLPPLPGINDDSNKVRVDAWFYEPDTAGKP